MTLFTSFDMVIEKQAALETVHSEINFNQEKTSVLMMSKDVHSEKDHCPETDECSDCHSCHLAIAVFF